MLREIFKGAWVSLGRNKTRSTLTYGAMRGHFIEEGCLISPEDVQYARRVVVLGNGLRERLFSEAPAVGEDVRIGGVPITVIGVLRKKVSLSNYFGLDDKNAFIPHTAMRTLSQIRYLSVMVVQTVNPAMVGLLSGFFPAYRASRLAPIEALRYE